MNKRKTENLPAGRHGGQRKTILVTGGAGFIGSHILDLLIESGYQIIIIERSGSNLDRISEYLSKIKIYFSDQNGLQNAFEENKIDTVIHLATRYLKTHESTADVESILDTNVKMPSIICQLCIEHQVKYFINTGTFFEYKNKDAPLKESDPKWAYNLYAASKLAFEEILKFYSANYDLKVIDFKLFAPFGDRDNDKLMSYLVKVLNSGEKVDFSGGEQSWNFTYVKDIAIAYLKAIENIDKIQNYELINVGYEKAVSIREIAEIFEKISGKKFKINWGAKPYAENEIMYANADISKLKSLLHYQPEFTLEDGLKATYEYFSKNGSENG